MPLGRRVHFVYYAEQHVVCRDIGHGMAVVRVTHITFLINDTAKRHPSGLEKVYLLPVQQGDAMRGVRHTDEWNSFSRPVTDERLTFIGTDRQDFRSPLRKIRVAVPQARQLRAA